MTFCSQTLKLKSKKYNVRKINELYEESIPRLFQETIPCHGHPNDTGDGIANYYNQLETMIEALEQWMINKNNVSDVLYPVGLPGHGRCI